MKTSQKFTYLNSTDAELNVIVEPWYDQFKIAPGQLVEIIVYDEGKGGIVEFEQLPIGLIIYGYEGCIIEVDGV
jgi:hypothetical protein